MERNFWHGVDNVRHDECPKFWNEEVKNWGFGRFNLQFRDPTLTKKTFVNDF